MPPSPTGPLYAGTGASASGANGVWTTPSNATGAPDATYTSGNISGAGSQTNYLQLTNFGFNLPATAIIDGLYVEFEAYGSNAATKNIQIMKGGSQTGTIKTGADIWPPSEGFISYGSATDLWGASFLYSDINGSGFGIAISAYNITGGGTAFIDAVRITVYWHTAPTSVPKRYIYKVYNQGNYVGNIPNVTTDYQSTQDINSGGSEISISSAVSIDTSLQATSPLLDETGANISDESSNNVIDDGVAPIAGPGTSGTNLLIRNGNQVVVYEYGYWHPNGQVVFRGHIQRWEADFGGDNADELINIVIYSDGNDLSNYLVIGPDGGYVLDQSQTSQNQGSGIQPGTSLGQTFTTGSSTTNIVAVALRLANDNANESSLITLYLCQTVGGAPIASTSLTLTSTTPNVYQFDFNTPIIVTPNTQYFFYISLANSIGGVVYNQTSNVYAGGQDYISYNGAWFPFGPNQDLYFQTLSVPLGTTVAFGSLDPSTQILSSILDQYRSLGGLLSYTSTSIQPTNLSILYNFNTNTVYEALVAMLSVSPNGFYYYVDLGSDILYFKQTNSTADIKLTKGYHIENLKVIATIEQMVNNAYFTGGSIGANNLYVSASDVESNALYGPFLDRPINNSVTDPGTALAIAESEIEELSQEQYSTTVSILDHTLDLTSLKPGMVVGFNGFGTFIDGLLAQIVRIAYTPEQVTLTLGLLPKRLHKEVEQVVRSVIGLSTIDNPNAPS